METPNPPPAIAPRSGRGFGWLALGLLLLLTGLGLGWRWWQTQNASPQAPAAASPFGQGVPVKLAAATTQTVVEYTEVIGALEAEASVEVRPEISGRVSQIYVSKGDRVEVGTPLVQLSPDEQAADVANVLASINAAQANRANARSQLAALQADAVAQVAEVELQQENYDRVATLAARGALSQQELDQARRNQDTAIAQLAAIQRRIEAAQAAWAEAEAGVRQAEANRDRAQAQLQDTTITAPLSGIVGDIPIKLGTVVTNQDLLTTLTRNQSLNLRLSIPLERAPDLQLGQRVGLTDPQGQVLQTGQISFISPQVTSGSQSILAEATFNNPTGTLRDGQFVRARVIWSERPGILIPTSAITRIAGEPFVFVAQSPEAPTEAAPVANPDGPSNVPTLVARQRQVQLGTLQGNAYHVLSGLNPGEQVIVSGVLNLSDGAPVMPAP
jgi:RND family efflux transporter MFP subunit